MKKYGKTFLSFVITALLVAYIYFNRHSIFDSFKHVHPAYLIPVFLGQIGIQFANSKVLKANIRPLGNRLGEAEAFKLTIVSSFVNFFTPVVGGASLKAVYLKKKHDISYPRFVSVLSANYLMFFISSFLLGIVAVLLLPGAITKHVGQVVALFFVCGIIGSVVFMAFGHKITRWLGGLSFKNAILGKFTKKISAMDEGWDLIRKDKRSMLAMGLWSGIATLFVALVYWGAMMSLGIHPSVWTTIIFAALAIIGLLFNITPGSIGIREAVYASIYTVTAISPKQVVAFSLIDRPAQLIVISLGWVLFGQSLLKVKNSK